MMMGMNYCMEKLIKYNFGIQFWTWLDTEPKLRYRVLTTALFRGTPQHQFPRWRHL